MHLQVGNVSEAQPFYSGVLGTDVTATYPGAAFYGAGGYHHQLATNMWGSRGAGPIDAKATGLVGFDLILDSNAQRDAILERAQSTGTSIRDPWGLELSLTSKEA